MSLKGGIRGETQHLDSTSSAPGLTAHTKPEAAHRIRHPTCVASSGRCECSIRLRCETSGALTLRGHMPLQAPPRHSPRENNYWMFQW